MSERFSDSLPIGMIVQWFPRADISKKPNFSEGPVPAMVLRSDDGICDLYVYHLNGQVRLHKAVYHTSHPDLKDSWSRVSEMGLRDGCWEFTDISKQQWDEQFAEKAAKAKEERRLQVEAKKKAEAEAEAKARAEMEAKRKAEKAASKN